MLFGRTLVRLLEAAVVLAVPVAVAAMAAGSVRVRPGSDHESRSRRCDELRRMRIKTTPGSGEEESFERKLDPGLLG